MAWSPCRRSNAGVVRVQHPGDYATSNSNQLRDGTGAAVSRLKLLERIGDTVDLGAGRLSRLADDDYSPDGNLARFPTFDAATKVALPMLFERWCEGNRTRVEASTIRRHTPLLNNLGTFVGDKDVRRVTQDDIWAWAEHRRDRDGLAASTVNRNDLVGMSAVLDRRCRASSSSAGSG